MKRSKRKDKSSSGKTKKQGLLRYEAERNLRNFCSATSHELANALGAIVGELDFARAHEKDREQSIGVALKAAERALGLARNLRYFAVHTRLDMHAVDLSQVLIDAIELAEKELEARGIQIEAFIEASTYATVDPSAVQQVIMNLLGHAAGSMPKGGKLTLALTKLEGQIEISCTNTGEPIPADKLETIFEPVASDENIPSLRDGEGLGLAVSKALVEAHGGEVSIRSEEKGTTVKVFLPFDAEGPKPSPFLEKRRFRRVQIHLTAEIQVEGTSLTTEITTLSVGGCFVRLFGHQMHHPETNSIISVRIFNYDDQVIEVHRARIASRIIEGLYQGVGVEFLDVDAKGKKLLSAIVKSHST